VMIADLLRRRQAAWLCLLGHRDHEVSTPWTCSVDQGLTSLAIQSSNRHPWTT
jgi:hypothetical protein